MPIFFRGAGVGTYWHNNDARVLGFTPKSPGVSPGASRMMQHVARGSHTSPYLSFSRSFGIAWAYGVVGTSIATQQNPGYVYELDIPDPLPPGVTLLDPLQEVAKTLGNPPGGSYQHDGQQDFLLGVVDPLNHAARLTAAIRQPPGSSGTPRGATLTLELETLVRTLRDAEVLALGNIPAAWVVYRHDVW